MIQGPVRLAEVPRADLSTQSRTIAICSKRECNRMVEMKANSGVLFTKGSKIHSSICQLEHQLLLKDLFFNVS